MIKKWERARRALIGTAAALLVAASLVATHQSTTLAAVNTPAAVVAVADTPAPAELETDDAVTDAPAWSLVAYSSCPTTALGCFFTDSNGGGAYWTISYSLGCKNFSSVWNDRASSVRNRTPTGLGGYLIRMWENANCSGVNMMTHPATDENMSWFYNDLGTSYAVYPCSQVTEC